MGTKIVGVVIGVLVVVFGIALFPNYAKGFDQLYRIYTPHCEVAGNTTLKLHKTDGTVLDVTGGAANVCATTLTASTDYVTEDGQSVAILANNITGGVWTTPPGVLTKFGGINKLLTSIGPMLVLVGFATTGLMVSRTYSGSIGSILTTEVIGLVIALVAINMVPVVVEFVEQSASATDDELTSTQQFGGITDLLWSLLPLLLTLTVIGMVVYSGHSMARGRKGGSSQQATMM